MSLNYGTLKTQILEDSHRSNSSQVTAKVDDFVRNAEGIIARRLRCAEMITRVDLSDSDRVTAGEGFYTLPSDFLEARSFYLNASDPVYLESVSLLEVRSIDSTAPVRYYNIIGYDEVEFRGVPSTTDTIELIYFARPTAFSADGDTNEILTRHESIYIYLALSALYEYTQDLELAQVAAQAGIAAIDGLNEQTSRMIGGGRTRGFYNFSPYTGVR
jgi:hypothetical protein